MCQVSYPTLEAKKRPTRESLWHTIAQVTALSDEELLAIPYLDLKALADIREKLAAYLAGDPLHDEVKEVPPETEPHAAKPVLHPLAESNISSVHTAISSSSQTPLKALSLSFHAYNILMDAGINTVEQLATMSLSEILSVPRIDYDRLAKIRRKLETYLAEHPLPDEAQQSPPEPESHAVEPLPLQAPSPPLSVTPLDVLGLSLRPYNALERRYITTVEQLARMSDKEITEVYQIGPKSLAEIQEKLQAYLSANPIPDVTSTQAVAPTTQKVEVEVPVISKEVIKWQVKLIEKQIAAGLLHKQARIAGKSIAHWLAVADTIDRHQAYETMASVLGTSINICEELAFLLTGIRITVLLSRYGLEPKTLSLDFAL